MTNGLRELSKYVLSGSSSAFLLYLGMIVYGDTTTTQYAVLMTAIYFVVAAVIILGLSYPYTGEQK